MLTLFGLASQFAVFVCFGFNTPAPASRKLCRLPVVCFLKLKHLQLNTYIVTKLSMWLIVYKIQRMWNFARNQQMLVQLAQIVPGHAMYVSYLARSVIPGPISLDNNRYFLDNLRGQKVPPKPCLFATKVAFFDISFAFAISGPK